MNVRKTILILLTVLCFTAFGSTNAPRVLAYSATMQETGDEIEKVRKLEEESGRARDAASKIKESARAADDDLRKAKKAEDEARKSGDQARIDKAVNQGRDAETKSKDANDRLKDADSKAKEALRKLEDARKTQSTVSKTGGEEGWFSYISSWAFPLLLGAAGIAALGALVYVSVRLINRALDSVSRYFYETLGLPLNDVRKRQDELHKQIITSTASSKDVNSRLTEIQNEISEIRKGLKADRRETYEGFLGTAKHDPTPFPVQVEHVPELKEDIIAFPISADEYLVKVRTSAVIVKPDFQNGILVSDPEGTGELMLTQDNKVPGGLLYIVPKVAHFQTKQDFSIYYEKYYECSGPSSGEVWIVEPAVVDKVTGGWKLRDKGILEVK